MSTLHTLQRLLLVLLLAAAAPAMSAAPFEPQIGQEGKDVIWVPTPTALIEKMLDAAKVTATDYVIDLGSGDGRTVIAAAKRGARALGIEYNPDMVELSKKNAATAGVEAKATFVKADIFESDFSQATVITMYLLPQLNLRLRPKLLDLKPGTHIVSHAFTMDDWRADETITAQDNPSYSRTAYHWIVPAKVEGSWQLGDGEISLKQTFQMLSGTLKSGNAMLKIENGRLRGDQISFSAGNIEYSGRVSGGTMSGSMRGGSSGNWSATRAGGR
jgi:precorrin-6B methylase 2